MDELTLIFSQHAEHLGELLTHNGALTRFMLTRSGELLFGEQIADWQTQGIVASHDVITQRKEGRYSQLIADHVQPRAPEFLTAFRHWSASHQLRLLTIQLDLVSCWEKMVLLPFEPEERFALMFAMSKVPVAERTKWMAALDDAQSAVENVH